MLARKARNIDFFDGSNINNSNFQKNRQVLVLSKKDWKQDFQLPVAVKSHFLKSAVRILRGGCIVELSNLIFAHFPIFGAGTHYAEISAL